ncbi:MAG: FtsQ-type POTRA domain-containing protein [Myxococcota bacterium]|nr:FtsQ-type POTRA domain-containing protein [Myxococcota bacterium]
MRGRAKGWPRPDRRVRAVLLGTGAALGLAAGLLVGPEALAALRGPRLALRSVAVAGQDRLTPTEVAAAAGLRAGAPLTAETLEAARTRLAGHPWIAAARVVALPPSRALLEVEERRPVARAALADGVAWVDRRGVPFAAAEAGDPAPLLVGVETAARGRAHPVLAQGVDLVRALEAHGLPPARRIVLGGAPAERLPALELADGGPRVVLGPGPVDARLARLARLRAADLGEAREASEIDLRFGDDVVLRSGPAPGGSGETGRRGGADPS